MVERDKDTVYWHFLLFPQCFHRTFSSGGSKSSLYGKELTLYHTTLTFNDPEKEAFRIHYGKKKKCW